MKKYTRIIQIITWLGIMAVLTVFAMGAWMILSGGSQSTASLKWLQCVQTAGTFLLPPILCALLWDENHQPMRWLRMDRGADWRLFLLAIGIMVCAIPGINLLADLNRRFLDWLLAISDWLLAIGNCMKSMEESAAVLTERFLAADNIGELLLNIGLMALLPALSEEMTFRGTLQQTLYKRQSDKGQGTMVHLAIWVTAFIFSAIHMQFYGFIPRMLLGAMFGYVFLWSSSLWVPIVMHFTNNGLAVLVAFCLQHSAISTNIADTIGAGDTWYLGIVSLVITCPGLLIFYRRTHKQ